MNPLYPTAHAAMRKSQRGLANDDIELIRWIGTEVEGDTWCAKKDFQALDRELKQLRDQVRKLVGKRFRPRARDDRRCLNSHSGNKFAAYPAAENGCVAAFLRRSISPGA